MHNVYYQIRQLQAEINQLKKELHEFRPDLDLAELFEVDHVAMHLGIPPRPLTEEQLQPLTEKFKKNGFELTPALADDPHVQGGVVDSSEFCPAAAP